METSSVSQLWFLYRQSDYCPSISKIVKSAACIAGAILGLRFAPRATMTLISSAALYYGVWRSPPPPQVIHVLKDPPPSTSDLEEPSEAEATNVERGPVPSNFTSLNDVQDWIADCLENPGRPTDLLPAINYLHAQCPENLNILEWEPGIPGSLKFHRALESSPKFQELKMTYSLQHTPEGISNLQGINSNPMVQTLFALTGASISDFTEFQKSLREDNTAASQIYTLITQTIKEFEPVLQRETVYMRTLFFLCATLHRHPSLVEPLAARLKPLTESEEDLKNRKLRGFIMQLLFLSEYPQFYDVLRNLNPEKFAQNQQTYSKRKHPFDETQLGTSSYIHLLACKEWYRVTQQDRYLSLLDRLRKIVTAPRRIFNFEDYLGQTVEARNWMEPLLKNSLAKEINESKLLPPDPSATFPYFFNEG